MKISVKEGLSATNTSEEQLYNLWLLLERTRYKIFRAREKELQQLDLEPQQAGILFIISTVNDVTPAELSRRISREPQTITSVLNTMVRKGLVVKRKDLKRKNLVRLALTRKGEGALACSVQRDSIYWIMTSLPEEKRRQLQSCLEELFYWSQMWSNRDNHKASV